MAAEKAALRRRQASALLIRTWHWQRRQYCNIFCVFVFPSIMFILLTVLNRVLKQDFKQDDGGSEPLGAFMPRPFSPERCAFPDDDDITNNLFGDLNQTSVADQCLIRDPNNANDVSLRPAYVMPVYADPSVDGGRLPALVGQHDARDEPERSVNNTGVMAGFSLDPFAYPPAVDEDDPFFTNQTEFDGILLHEHFRGINESQPELYKVYKAVANVYLNNKADSAYEARSTVPFTQLTQFRDFIYDKWYVGSLLDRFYSAIAFHALSIPGADGSDGDATQPVSGNFTAYYNESQPFTDGGCYILCPLLSSVSRTYSAIWNQIQPGKRVINLLRRMPHVDPFEDLGFFQLIISIVIALVTHFLLPWFVSFLVVERVSRMRDFLAAMGMPRWLYWVGTYLSFFYVYAASIFVSYIIAVASGIPFFRLNSPVSLVILFFLWGNALISLAIFLEPFFSDAQTAQITTWFIVIAINFLGGPYIGQRVSDEDTSTGLWVAIMILPSFAYMRSVYYAGAFNSADEGITVTPTEVRGIQLGMCANRGPFCWTYGFLLLDTVILLVLAAYVRFLVSRIKAGNLHPLFFLGMKRPSIPAVDDEDDDDAAKEKMGTSADTSLAGLIGVDVDDEKKRAADIVTKMSSEPFDGVVLYGVGKTYGGATPVRAVRSLSMAAKRGEVLTILGHNGAGKTTFVRCLVGELTPTAGDAYVNGYSVITDLDAVHEHMGFAAQQDILWPDLNVQEHLFFFGRIKGLFKQRLKDAVNTSLDNVQLDYARKRRVKALSGGMRRRLSVSIAMMGDSSFVVLDEPSTGLDLLSRERLWHAINAMRAEKSIILTTHSLEEAETLSDRVAIMSQGTLKCIGTSEELKLRLGDGHRLSVSLPESMFSQLLDELTGVAPGTIIDTVVGNNVELVLPKNASIPAVLTKIAERKRELRISDWAIQQSSLEDVFVKVTRAAQQSMEKEDGMVQP